MIDFVKLKSFLLIAKIYFKYCTFIVETDSESHMLGTNNSLPVVVHHENIHELASLRLLILNLECQNI